MCLLGFVLNAYISTPQPIVTKYISALGDVRAWLMDLLNLNLRLNQ